MEMQLTLTEKLRREVERYRNKDFLKAVLAVCALSARANPTIALDTRYRIDRILDSLDLVELFDRHKVTEILNDYIYAFEEDRARAVEVLDAKVRRIVGDHKKSRTLLRIAYLIMMADERMSASEQAEFDRLCQLLSIEPEVVTSGLQASAAG
jgi:tellurite resistance protein